jgi:hypothetical protein
MAALASKQRDIPVQAFGLAVAAGIFALDLVSGFDVSVASLYILVLLLAAGRRGGPIVMARSA